MPSTRIGLGENNRKYAVLIGSSHPELGNLICQELGIKPAIVKCGFFRNGETKVEICESIRGFEVFIVQTGIPPANDNLMELLVMIHSCKFASASRITAIIPNYPYAKQNKKSKSREPISAKLVADMLTTAGANHIITMDLHASQVQGFFNIPVDNLFAEPLFAEWIRNNIFDHKSAILIAPNTSGVKRVAFLADILKIEFAFIHKERRISEDVKLTIVGNINHKTVIIIDDIADSCGTIIKAATKLKEEGAKIVYVMCVHGIFSEDSISNLIKSPIDRFVITNTVSISKKVQEYDKLTILDVSPIFAEAVRRTVNNQSVSFLFQNFIKSSYSNHSGPSLNGS